MKKGWKAFLIILFVLGILSGMGYVAYTRYGEKIALLGQKQKQELDITTPVAVSTVKQGAISEILSLNGEVVPVKEVNIFSTVPGKVKKIYAREGSRVNKGDILAHIDRSEAGLTYAPAPVESTMEGIVKSVMVEEGAYITPQVPLFQIIDIDTVEVVVNIPEKEIYRIRQGLPAKIKLISYPGRIFRGEIYRLSPVVNPVSRTREARIRIMNKGHVLKPGMFGEVKIILRRENRAVIIPISAVTNRDGEQVVFVVRDSRAVMVSPKLGIQEGEFISVESGLKPGEKVIVIGQHNISDGDRINISEEID